MTKTFYLPKTPNHFRNLEFLTLTILNFALLIFFSQNIFAQSFELREKVENSGCVECHNGKFYPEGEKIYDKFKKDVHFQKYEMICTDCHGGNLDGRDEFSGMYDAPDWESSPTAEKVSEFCGRCHKEISANFDLSVHFAPSQKREFRGCLECHGVHGIQEPTSMILENKCQKCHNEGIAEVDYGKNLVRLLESLQNEFESLEKELVYLEQEKTLLTPSEIKLVKENLRIKKYLIQNLHSLDLELVNKSLDSVKIKISEAKEIFDKAKSIQKQRENFVWLVWALTFGIVFLLWIKLKNLNSKD